MWWALNSYLCDVLASNNLAGASKSSGRITLHGKLRQGWRASNRTHIFVTKTRRSYLLSFFIVSSGTDTSHVASNPANIYATPRREPWYRDWIYLFIQDKRIRHYQTRERSCSSLTLCLVYPCIKVAFDGRSSDSQETTQLLLTTSTGALQLWQHEKMLWSRDEALSTVRVVAFVSFPPPGASSGLPVEASVGEGIGETILKHVRRFSERMLQHFYAPYSASESTGCTGQCVLHGDTFGLRQVIVAATAEGALCGIDSSTGEVLWRRLFGLGWAAEERVGGKIVPVKMFVMLRKVRSTGNEVEEESGRETVVLVTQRAANNVCHIGVFRAGVG